VSVLPIRITGDPVLHQRAVEVGEITQEIKNLVADMFETMEKAPGVGLAAPQIGIGLRIFVFDYEVEDLRFRDVAINPTLELQPYEESGPDEELEVEGCLSIPGERFPIRRSDSVVLKATDLSGSTYEIAAEGWLARIFQHEFDHLNGTLYADRLIEPYSSEIKELIEDYGWGVAGNSWTPGVEYLEP